MKLIQGSELSDCQRLTFRRARRECRLDSAGQARGAVVFAHFAIRVGVIRQNTVMMRSLKKRRP